MPFSLDQFLGGFTTLMLGDALGAPYEFYKDQDRRYTKDITLEPRIYNPYTRDFRSGVSGQITDDSEMTMCVLRSLVNLGTFRNDLIIAYLDWANSDTKMIGRNTRSLFKGVKTVKGYKNRVEKLELNSESNGTLMRALPYVFVKDSLTEDLSTIDQLLTNKNKTTKLVLRTYITLSKALIVDKLPRSNAKKLAKEIGFDISAYPLTSDREGYKGKTKGWIVYPLVFLLNYLEEYPFETSSLETIYEDITVNHRGCDSDTILAIVFGVYGSAIGYKELCKSKWFVKNFQKVLDADTLEGGFPRPEKFWASTFFDELPILWKNLQGTLDS